MVLGVVKNAWKRTLNKALKTTLKSRLKREVKTAAITTIAVLAYGLLMFRTKRHVKNSFKCYHLVVNSKIAMEKACQNR